MIAAYITLRVIETFATSPRPHPAVQTWAAVTLAVVAVAVLTIASAEQSAADAAASLQGVFAP
jgi:hypothetical protein